MTKAFEFELVDPESRIIDEPMWQVVMPGTEGEFGVRAGHCALVSSLRSGVLTVWRTEEDLPGKYFVNGGFAHVTAENCTVLVESAQDLNTLDQAAIEQEISNLEDQRSLTNEHAENVIIDEKLDLARTKLNAIKFYS